MTTLTLAIEGPPGRVPATALAGVLTESLKILEDLRERARDSPVTWYVTELRIGSAVAQLSADDAAGGPNRLAREYVNGLRLAEAGEALPPFFSDTSLVRLQRMAKPLGTQDAAYLEVSVGQNGSTESVRAHRSHRREHPSTPLAAFEGRRFDHWDSGHDLGSQARPISSCRSGVVSSGDVLLSEGPQRGRDERS